MDHQYYTNPEKCREVRNINALAARYYAIKAAEAAKARKYGLVMYFNNSRGGSQNVADTPDGVRINVMSDNWIVRKAARLGMKISDDAVAAARAAYAAFIDVDKNRLKMVEQYRKMNRVPKIF